MSLSLNLTIQACVIFRITRCSMNQLSHDLSMPNIFMVVKGAKASLIFHVNSI